MTLAGNVLLTQGFLKMIHRLLVGIPLAHISQVGATTPTMWNSSSHADLGKNAPNAYSVV
jgi:hypothetical protein